MKKDLRIIKTERNIKNAFVQLIMEKSYKNVKIKDIVERAMINRNTFYLHYSSKENLADAVINDATKALSERLNPRRSSPVVNDTDVISVYINKLLEILKEYKPLLKAVLLDPGLTGYFFSFKSALTTRLLNYVDKSLTKNKIIVSFALSGLYGVIERWIMYDDLTQKDISEECAKLCVTCVKDTSYKDKR